MGAIKKNINLFVNIGATISIHKINYLHYLSIAVMVIVVFGLPALTAVGAYVLLPAQMHYHIKKTFVISQESGDDIVYLGIILPKSGPYQTVNNLTIQWDGVQEQHSRAYVDLLKLSHHLTGKSGISAVVEYDITLNQGKIACFAPVEANDLLP